MPGNEPDSKLVKIAENLLKKSREAGLDWEQTADEDTFKVSFEDHTITIYNNSAAVYPQHKLTLLNPDGRVLDSVRSIEGEPLHNTLSELHKLARRNALKVDEAIDRILELSGS